MAVARADLELVAVSRRDMRNEDLPHAATAARAHRVAAAVPGVEVADHRDAAGIRRPDGEANAIDIADGHRMRAEKGVGPQVRALAEEVKIGVGDQRTEGVRVGVHAFVAVGPLHGEAIVEAVLAPRDRAFPQAGGVAQREFGGALAGGASTTATLVAPGSMARSHSLLAVSACKPSTANGSPWRASINAATSLSASMTGGHYAR